MEALSANTTVLFLLLLNILHLPQVGNHTLDEFGHHGYGVSPHNGR
jgi:hypothetical protein